MTKKEAIELFVSDLSAIPTEWVQIIAENKGLDIHAWPMWGTMFLCDDFIAEKLTTRTESEENESYDEEMLGAENILDKEGNETSMYLYDIDGQHAIGIHGAGFNFYDGVWDKLYDALGLEWHEEIKTNDENELEANLLDYSNGDRIKIYPRHMSNPPKAKGEKRKTE